MITVRRTKDRRLVTKLNDRVFPGEPFSLNPHGAYWIARQNEMPVGFAGLHPLTYEPTCAFLARAGLLPIARGQGLHKKLIKVRVQYAIKHEFDTLITYTMEDNVASANNLAACGFKLYTPEYRWADSEKNREVLYFRMDL